MEKITPNSPRYPKFLKQTSVPPLNLYFFGTLPAEKEAVIAIVGTRKATQEGKTLAKKIAAELSKRGLTIISGLALGIDAAAHEGALCAGGKTIAVLGNGLKFIYPRQNEKIGKMIIEKNGALISEYPPEAPPLPHQFLERNRIISGISIATVVIEAPERSGSLVTAKLALEEGREVFVVPGPANHPNFKGSHILIREGARLVTSAEDILGDLESVLKNFNLKLNKTIEISQEQKKLLELFKASKYLTLNEIMELAKLSPQVISRELTLMQLENLIIEKNGKFKLV